jgi:RNase adaptor protein for sRNA GlmZ degradation
MLKVVDIAFICNHGKHRSVGWAELLKKIYYKKSIIKHLCRKNWVI